jgi:hypothetical protein
MISRFRALFFRYIIPTSGVMAAMISPMRNEFDRLPASRATTAAATATIAMNSPALRFEPAWVRRLRRLTAVAVLPIARSA